MIPTGTHDSELKALLNLLEDPDPHIQKAVRARLRDIGPDLLPFLELARLSSEGAVGHHLKEVIQMLRFSVISDEWIHIMSARTVNLERGAFLLCRYRFWDVEVPRYTALLDEWATAARDRIFHLQGAQRAFALSDFMFGDLGFEGNMDNYYDPNNSYLNWVLDQRSGIPVSLSVVYLLLADRLDLPVFGVNMPAHFLVKYDDGGQEIFIDVFNAGTPLSKADGEKFLKRAGIDPAPQYFLAVDNHIILLRMVRNLLAIAYESGQQHVIDDFSSLLAPWTSASP